MNTKRYKVTLPVSFESEELHLVDGAEVEAPAGTVFHVGETIAIDEAKAKLYAHALMEEK